MEIRRRLAGMIAFALIATTVLSDAAPVYGAQDVTSGAYEITYAATETELTVTDAEPEDGLVLSEEASDEEAASNALVAEDDTVLIEEDDAQAENAGLIHEEEEITGEVVSEEASMATVPVVDYGENTVSGNGFVFQINNLTKEATVIKWTGTGKAVIPDAVELSPGSKFIKEDGDRNRTVAAIGGEAFNASLTEVEIPQTVRRFEANAFKGCTLLTKVTMPNIMDNLDANAFDGCISLSEAKLPAKLTNIGLSVFKGCTALTSIVIPNDMDIQTITSLPQDRKQGPFSNAANLKNITFETGTKKVIKDLFAACSSIEQIALPDTMTTVEAEAFINCANLKKVTMTNSMTEIGDGAFSGCTKLERMDMSPYLKTVGIKAFYNCNTMSECSIPDNMKQIGESAFEGCTSLKKLTFIEGDKAGYVGATIGKRAFFGCSMLEKLCMPNSFTTIGVNAFTNCTTLSEARIENKFEDFNKDINIQEAAFMGDTGLLKLTLDEKIKLKSIGKNAFNSCSSLGAVKMPDTVETLGDSAFAGCTSLSGNQVILSKGLKTLGAAVFKGDIKITAIEIPKSITTVNVAKTENGIFRDCTGLKEITFEKGITEIPNNLLWGTGNDLSSVEHIYINDTVKSIGNNAFRECRHLNILEIPDSVKTIGNFAFYKCTSLGKPRSGENLIPNSVITIGESAFEECRNLGKMVLPDGLTSLGKAAFKNSTVSEAYVPNSVTTLGASCFEDCKQLTKIHLPENMTDVPDSIFSNCEVLTTVNLSKDKLKTIGKSAFKNCDALKLDGTNKLDLSGFKVLNEIKANAFQDCDNITAVYLSPATTTIGDYVFDNCNNLSDISLGTGLTTIPQYAFSNLGSLEKMTIPRNVLTIKAHAFENDPRFVELHIPKTTKTIEEYAFSYCDHLTIYVVAGSAAHEYVKQYGIDWKEEKVYVVSINFVDDEISLAKGASTTPVVEILPVNYSEDVTYTSSDVKIFTVDPVTGLLNGVSTGEAELTASALKNEAGEKVTAKIKVKVYVAVSGVTLDKTSATLEIGEELKLTATVKPDDAVNKNVRWTSSDSSVATVVSGNVVAEKAGTAKITVTTEDGGKTAVCTITVNKGPDPTPIITPIPVNVVNKTEYPKADPMPGIVKKGTRVILTCATPDSSIYYTTDGSAPTVSSDAARTPLGTTKLYTDAFVVENNLSIKAIATSIAGKDSDPVTFSYTVNKDWGDVSAALRMIFGNDPGKVPTGMWYSFTGDSKIYSDLKKDTISTNLVKEYTGKKLSFGEDINVYFGTTRLVEGRDYSVVYKNTLGAADPTSAKAPTFTVKGKDNYAGSRSFTFTIGKIDINRAVLTSERNVGLAVNTKLSAVRPVIKYGTKKLTKNKDYDLTFYRGTQKVAESTKAQPGEYTVKITAHANGTYTGEMYNTVTVVVSSLPSKDAILISKARVTIPKIPWENVVKEPNTYIENLFKNGSAVVKSGKNELTYGVHYTLPLAPVPLDGQTYPSAGKYALTIRGIGSVCVGDKVVNMEIVGTKSTKVKVACLNIRPLYGADIVSVGDLYKPDKTGFSKVTLYTGSIKDPHDIGSSNYEASLVPTGTTGKYQAVFVLKNGYSGTIKKNVKASAYNIKKDPNMWISITHSPVVYNKAGVKPEVSVYCNSKKLKENTDYTVTYSKTANLKPGATAYFTVKGKGMFTGSVKTQYTVDKAEISKASLQIDDIAYKADAAAGYFKAVPKVVDNGVALVAGKDINKFEAKDVSYYFAGSEDQISDATILPPGQIIEARLKVTCPDSSQYTGEAVLKGYYRVIYSDKDISTATVELKNADALEYSDGDEVIPLKSSDLTVKLGKVSLKATDYEIVSVTNNRFVGTATIEIVGKGAYGGRKTATVKIVKRNL